MPSLHEAKKASLSRARARKTKTETPVRKTVRKKKTVGEAETGDDDNKKIPARRGRPPQIKTIRARVQAVLLELMAESESDAVRVSAAKTLLDKLKLYEKDDDTKEGSKASNGRESAVKEAAILLEQLAAAKSGGFSLSVAVDQDSAGGAADAAGELADLADHGRARLGENADRG